MAFEKPLKDHQHGLLTVRSGPQRASLRPSDPAPKGIQAAFDCSKQGIHVEVVEVVVELHPFIHELFNFLYTIDKVALKQSYMYMYM